MGRGQRRRHGGHGHFSLSDGGGSVGSVRRMLSREDFGAVRSCFWPRGTQLCGWLMAAFRQRNGNRHASSQEPITFC
ncbi:hypothetical protein F8B43_3078 [Methylorubrum populi]|uniref:Uncharacterized protein n=1 Tax=Methylorubrum populi TaxID=223967 RepID=A0A833J5M2_9HYPH|nr:hypothetical protein F8B43_3078 [Methylorubrum populi]